MIRKISLIALALSLLSVPGAHAHFGMVIPSDDIISQGDPRQITVRLMFAHPFEMEGMPLVKPAKFDVVTGEKKTDLSGKLREIQALGQKAWKASYTFKKPGVYAFCMEPQPYWEPAEDCYIVHYTKVILGAFGLEEGWDAPAGLKTEIIPLSRPFGLYAGNVFRGVVLLDGKPVPNCEVEVEYYNQDKKYTAPDDAFITQVVMTDADGVFAYAAPRAGWWGFAALNTSDEKIKGKDVELGAVIWVKFHDME
jgi:cobalt/nickel transport protein